MLDIDRVERFQRDMMKLHTERLAREAAFRAAGPARVAAAMNELYEHKRRFGVDRVWAPLLGPCTAVEREEVRRKVAERITHEAAMGAWFTP